jgi:hypothetical protein
MMKDPQRTARVEIRVKEAEREAIERQATKEHRKFSEMVRILLLRGMEKTMNDAPKGQRSPNLVEARLTGVAQSIMAARAKNDPEEPGEQRDIIDAPAALAAIDLAAMNVGRVFESGMPMDVELASHLMALLMIAREYIEPLPGGINADGTEGLSSDLTTMVGRLGQVGLLDWSMAR